MSSAVRVPLPSQREGAVNIVSTTNQAFLSGPVHRNNAEDEHRACDVSGFSAPLPLSSGESTTTRRDAHVAPSTGAGHLRSNKHHTPSPSALRTPPSSSAKEHGAATAQLLRRVVCCSSCVQNCLRPFGFLKDEEDAYGHMQLLACACAAIAVLLVLLLTAVTVLVIVFVVVLPDTQWQLRQTSMPSLDFNRAKDQRKGQNRTSLVSPFDLKRVLAASGLDTFLQQVHEAEQLRRRVWRNETLLAAIRRSREWGGNLSELVSLAQSLPELERLSSQLLRVSAYVTAVHAHDPSLGLVELGDFLLNVKGRTAALARAAALARREAAGAEWNVALKTTFAGRAEASRLRAQLRGFVGVAAGQAERWTRQPFDDVAMLQYRHAWTQLEVVPQLARRADENKSVAEAGTGGVGAAGGGAGATSAYAVANRAALKADLYEASSIFNHVYYYPLRRYAALRAYSPATVADTDAWYAEVAAGVQARFGAAVTAHGVDAAAAAAVPVAVRGSPLSVLSLPRLPAARKEEVTHLLTAEDVEWMPAGLRAGAAVNRQTIFISLASYRDMECSPTLLDLFRVARNPYRVYVGLAQQNRAGDTPCLLPEMYGPFLCAASGVVTEQHAAAREAAARRRVLHGGVDFRGTQPDSGMALFDERVCFLSDHVRVRDIDSRQAKGPTYGRYMAMLLYRGEDLTLVLDSHNKFRPMWDTLGTSMLTRYDDPKAAMSHYPEAYTPDKADIDVYKTTTAYLCKAFFMKKFGYLRLNGIVIGSPDDFVQNNKFNDLYVATKSDAIRKSRNFRLPQPWVAGGFLFSSATIFRDVPFDPHLPYVFDGEEVLYSMRLWTHGYNLYSPPRGLCFHIYGRPKAPKVWSEFMFWYTLQDQVRPRIQFFLQSHIKDQPNVIVPADTRNAYVVVDSSRYGIGKQRTVAQWYDYAGANPVNYSLDGKWCGVDTTEM